jgi:hypothetical protein
LNKKWHQFKVLLDLGNAEDPWDQISVPSSGLSVTIYRNFLAAPSFLRHKIDQQLCREKGEEWANQKQRFPWGILLFFSLIHKISRQKRAPRKFQQRTKWQFSAPRNVGIKVSGTLSVQIAKYFDQLCSLPLQKSSHNVCCNDPMMHP